MRQRDLEAKLAEFSKAGVEVDGLNLGDHDELRRRG